MPRFGRERVKLGGQANIVDKWGTLAARVANAEHTHAQAISPPGHFGSDAAETDNEHGLAAYLQHREALGVAPLLNPDIENRRLHEAG